MNLKKRLVALIAILGGFAAMPAYLLLRRYGSLEQEATPLIESTEEIKSSYVNNMIAEAKRRRESGISKSKSQVSQETYDDSIYYNIPDDEYEIPDYSTMQVPKTSRKITKEELNKIYDSIIRFTRENIKPTQKPQGMELVVKNGLRFTPKSCFEDSSFEAACEEGFKNLEISENCKNSNLGSECKEDLEQFIEHSKKLMERIPQINDMRDNSRKLSEKYTAEVLLHAKSYLNFGRSLNENQKKIYDNFFNFITHALNCSLDYINAAKQGEGSCGEQASFVLMQLMAALSNFDSEIKFHTVALEYPGMQVGTNPQEFQNLDHMFLLFDSDLEEQTIRGNENIMEFLNKKFFKEKNSRYVDLWAGIDDLASQQKKNSLITEANKISIFLHNLNIKEIEENFDDKFLTVFAHIYKAIVVHLNVQKTVDIPQPFADRLKILSREPLLDYSCVSETLMGLSNARHDISFQNPGDPISEKSLNDNTASVADVSLFKKAVVKDESNQKTNHLSKGLL